MANKFNFTSESLLDNKFTANVKGYDPLEVDETLDKVIKDYEMYNELLKEANDKNAKHLQTEENLQKELADIQLEVAKLKKKIETFPKGEMTQDNYALLKKVNAYERVLYRKGINPQKALSDPDNC